MHINWCGYSWETQERWGQVHPEKRKWWYDPQAVIIDNSGWLNLLTRHNPKRFPFGVSNVGAGLVSCNNRFGYGSFEVECKLPYGKHLWPAFWMYSWSGMTPEIDVFEGYTNDSDNYKTWNPFKPWRVETNLFYGIPSKMIGGKTHSWGDTNPSVSFCKYRVEWRSDSVKYFYDDRLVREVKDQNILKYFNGVKMNVIINNGVDNDCGESPDSNFLVKYFKYTPF